MTGPCQLDPVTGVDRRRLQRPRARARSRVKAIEQARTTAMRAAFREELGAVVRSASPLLISLLEMEGLTLDEAVMLIEPHDIWPLRPRSAGRGQSKHQVCHYALLRSVASLPPVEGLAIPHYGHRMDRATDSWLRIEVIDHSLEVKGGIGPILFQTRFGEFRVELREAIPQTLLIGSIGRLLEEVVDHPAFRAQGWRIVAVEDAALPDLGQMLVAVTGSVEYRMPWAR